MFRYVALVDRVLESIDEHVAAHAPERGGGLLGPIGLPVITAFVPDPAAAATSATFRTSPGFQQTLHRIESANPNLELKGIVHSHPGTMSHPSAGDSLAFADSLRLAPWLGRFVNPIVTSENRKAKPHEIRLPSGMMAVYVSELRTGGKVDIQPAQVQVLPVGRDTDRLAAMLGATASPIVTVDIDGVVYISVVIGLTGLELKLLFAPMYPFQAPIVLAERTGTLGQQAAALLRRFTPSLSPGEIVPMAIDWDLAVPEELRLEHALTRPVTVESTITDRAGIGARLHGVVTERLGQRRVLLVGAGSGGSRTAEALIRSGVRHIDVVDPDHVAIENLSRSVYHRADVDLPKVHALARLLRSIDSGVEVHPYHDSLQALSSEQLDELVRRADLVVAATDDPAAQLLLNHYAYWNKVPAVFGGVYAKGHAGEVVFTVPGITRCYRCSTTSRHQDENQARTVDYGTGRLHGEPALGADIDHIVTASVKIALGLLQLDDEEKSSSRDLVYEALAANYNYLIISTVPKYGFLADVFESTPGQHAYQSVWLAVTGDRSCTVCGDCPIDPRSRSHTPPRVDVLSTKLTSQPNQVASVARD